MSKLIMMRGLPASGKSTRAKELETELGNAVRLNLDLLREMLHYSVWSGTREGLTQEAELALANRFLTKNMVVIVDDTNLGQSHLDKWKNVALAFNAKFEVVDMETSLEDCILRDNKRADQVGFDVITNMARRYGRYPFEKQEIICDIDGTIANCKHRQHFLADGNKNWKAFFDEMGLDTPIKETIDYIQKQHDSGIDIILVSGRPDSYKKTTMLWLDVHKVPYKTLIMRRSGDNRPDEDVKRDILNQYFKRDKIVHVIDDRPKVIRMWKEEGLVVMDVGDGKEF